MNAVILCAGFATRMYPLTKNFPKPLLEVGEKTVLDYLVDQLILIPEIRTIHLVSNAKFFDHFSTWHRNREAKGLLDSVTVHLHNDGCFDNENRLGAAGDLLLALRAIKQEDRVLVSGGDNIFTFSLKSLWNNFLKQTHHLITALEETDPEKLRKTGVLNLDPNDYVQELDEKPIQPQSTWISPPLYFFQPSVLNRLERFLETEGNHDAPGHFISYLCREEPVKAARVHGKRYDIGSLETYHYADRQLRNNPIQL